MAMDCKNGIVAVTGPGNLLVKINLETQLFSSTDFECEGASCVRIISNLSLIVVGCFDAWFVSFYQQKIIS